jgi:tRNA A37 threonylcarbamoyladenosine modification protein TsaB
MTAKTWASVLGKPIAGIRSLDALAAEYVGVSDMLVVPILPCRKEVVYACAFDIAGALPSALLEPAAFPLTELVTALTALPQERLLFCGPAAARYGADLCAVLEAQGRHCSSGEKTFPSVEQIGLLAARWLKAGFPTEDPVALVPFYISPPPISTPKTPIP